MRHLVGRWARVSFATRFSLLLAVLAGVVLAMPAAEIAVRGNVATVVVLLAATAVIGLILAAAIVRFGVQVPLRRLDRAAAAIARGELEQPIPANPGADSIGRLAVTLDSTRRRLATMLTAARARGAVAGELNSAQPLRTALQRVCAVVRAMTQTREVIILVAASPVGDAFVVSDPIGLDVDVARLIDGGGPIVAALQSERAPIHIGQPDGDGHVAAAPIHIGATGLGVIAVRSDDERQVRASAEIVITAAEQLALALERYSILAVIETQANTDDLTGLHNHRFLVDYLGQQVALAQRQRRPLSVLMLDLDHFKRLNDGSGHHVGDRALQAFAAAVTATIRRSDLAARYGGEEFAIVMPDTAGEEAVAVAEKVRSAVEEIRIEGSSGMVGFTVSIGAATFPADTESGEELLRLADEALYVAKANGRNRVIGSDLRDLHARAAVRPRRIG